MAAAAAAAPAPAAAEVAQRPRIPERARVADDPFRVGLESDAFFGANLYSAPGLNRLRKAGRWLDGVSSGRVAPSLPEMQTVFWAAIEEKTGGRLRLHPGTIPPPPVGYGGHAPSPGFPPVGYGYGFAPAPPSWPMSFGFAPQQYGAAPTTWSVPLERPPPDAVFETETTVGGRRLDERGGGAPVCLDYVRGRCDAGPTSLAVVKSSRRRRLPPSWPSRVASFWPFGLKAPRAGQPIFLSGHRRHGAPTFFIIGGSSPEHGRHPSSGIEWCAFGGIRPVP
ncbi:unnamed protein product [Pelagomonas calceolata]|uniref:Uncharacterized protein n=1 Tax=Pelagomonas calceolata TaxID=35677 RepID=A0A8J2SSK6_9STRA|nr:unnamed protein product [Pelagomonas calceolata]